MLQYNFLIITIIFPQLLNQLILLTTQKFKYSFFLLFDMARGSIHPAAIGYVAGDVVSLIKPFKERRKKEDIKWNKGDESCLLLAREFLETALEYGPYNLREHAFNLPHGDQNTAESAWVVLKLLVNREKEHPIDLRTLKSKLELYIGLLGRMERWELPENSEEISQLEDLDGFWRVFIDYTDKENSKEHYPWKCDHSYGLFQHAY